MDKNLEEKYKKVCEIIKSKKKVLIAFSGGVDSSLLAVVSKRILGRNAIAVTINSPTLPPSELKDAKKIAKEIGIKHIIVEDGIGGEEIVKNSADRCYYCKKNEILILMEIARKNRIESILAGTNADDFRDYRPGNRAFIEEGILLPLVEIGIRKEEVRKLAKTIGLSNSEKPSMACLASRIPYGEEITEEGLKMIEKAEDFIMKFGVQQVRVRHYKEIARIEVPEKDFSKILRNRVKMRNKLKSLGFKYITLDMEGYRSGSMNEIFNFKS